MIEMTKKPELPHYSKRIVELRDARGLSQKDLAALAFVTAPAITMWETGKRFPRGKNLKNLAAALGVSEASIMDSSTPIQVEKPANDRANLILDIQSLLTTLDEGKLRSIFKYASTLSSVDIANPQVKGLKSNKQG